MSPLKTAPASRVSKSVSTPRSKKRLDARRAIYRRLYVVAGVFLVLALVVLALALATGAGVGGALTQAAPMAVIAALYFWIVARARKVSAAVNAVNRSLVEVQAGHEAEAEAILGSIAPAMARRPNLRRAISLQRTILAMQRGDLEGAIAASAGTIDGRTALVSRAAEWLQILEGRARRALALASLGRRDEALADVAAVESSPLLGPTTLARTSLTRAVLLAKAGRVEELRAHYLAEGEALVEELPPRERSLSRALRRMGQPRARSVYREAATLEERGEDGEEARAWVRRISPEAARFVPAAAAAAEPTDAAASAATASALSPAATSAAGAAPLATSSMEAAFARARRGKGGQWKRMLVLWGVLIGMFLAIWTFLQPSPSPAHHPHAHVPPPSLSSTLATTAALPMAIIAALFLVVWAARRRQRKALRDLQHAMLQLARADDPQAEGELARLAKRGGPGMAPNAFLALGRHAIRRGDFTAATDALSAGIGIASSTTQLRAVFQDLLLPELLSTHAFALAAAGRADEARADLWLLDRDYPGFALAARAVYRVELLNAVTRGDLAGAARIVAARLPEMQVDLRVDLLGEIACAAAVGGLHDEAAEALQSELAAMPRVAHWIEQVAPGLTRRIARGHAVRVAEAPASEAHEDELPREEAHGAAAMLERLPSS